MTEANLSSNICLTTTGHDPEGRWVPYLENTQGILSRLYKSRLIVFTPDTSYQTRRMAEQDGWQVTVDDLKLGPARIKAMKAALSISCDFINLWDADRLLYAATIAPTELNEFVSQIPKYDFSLAGGTRKAIDSHQPSMTSWEKVKSWYLGYYTGIEGDIANRGCFAFSREFATFLLTYIDPNHLDEVDCVFPMMALIFDKFIQEGTINETERQRMGYAEFDNMTSHEDYIFEGLTREESRTRQNTRADFMRRGWSVLRQLQISDEIATRFTLISTIEPQAVDLYRRLQLKTDA